MRHIALFLGAGCCLAVSAASAADYKAGSLDISDPWSRATPKGASVATGYMTIKNRGSSPDRLVEGSSDVAAKFEVHDMKMENGGTASGITSLHTSVPTIPGKLTRIGGQAFGQQRFCYRDDTDVQSESSHANRESFRAAVA